MTTSSFGYRAFRAYLVPVRLFAFLTIGFICVSSVAAQTALTGGLRGNITDANGAAVPSATVRLENKSLSIKQETTTDADGRFTILNLVPATDYEMQVTANGFRASTRNGIAVISSETTAVDAKLEVAAVTETVDVNGEAQLAQTPEVSQIISGEQLNELPIYNRTQNRAALLDPHVRNLSGLGGDTAFSSRISINGRSFRETQHKLDGNANFDALYNTAPLQTVSLSAIQEYKILTNQYSAEHGGTSAGFLIATTKSGTNEFHGEGFFLGRPSGIQARPPLANRRIPNQLFQFGGSFGGAIFKDKTFFFVNYEGTRQDRGSFIDRPQPSIFVGKLTENIGLLKFDHRFTDNHTASLRLNGSRNLNTNGGDRITSLGQSAQPIQPSAAILVNKQEVGVQLNDNYVVNSNLVNEFRVSYVNSVPTDDKPITPSVVIIRNGISTEGVSLFSKLRLENTQIADQMSLQLGRHSMKFGGDYTRQQLDDTQYEQFGTYTFASNGTLINFRQQIGVADLRYGQSRFAAFFQDDWRVNPQLTLNLGLRYDYQSIIDDYNNFGPRVGFAYDVSGKGETVIRGGAGLYYDQPFLHGFTQLHLLNAPTALTRTITLNPTQLAAAGLTFPNSFDPRDPRAVPLAPRNVILPSEDFRNPYSMQFSLGIQRKLFGDFIANAEVIHNQSRGQLVNFNRNAPNPFPRSAPGQIRSAAAADATRPLTTFAGVPVRDVIVQTNGGNASYDALVLGVTKRFGNRYTFASNYVFSNAIDSLTGSPNEFSDVIEAERAPSDFNQRHRFITYGTIDLSRGFQAAGILTLASGQRINPVTGVDNNGDGRTVDRPVGFGRNSFQAKGQTRFDASLQKSFALPSMSETAKLEFRADVFNLFNNSNFYAFRNVYGNGATPNVDFGQPVGGVSNVDPGRQIQFAARFVF